MNFSQGIFINPRFVPTTLELSAADKLDELVTQVPSVDDNRVVNGKGGFNPSSAVASVTNRPRFRVPQPSRRAIPKRLTRVTLVAREKFSLGSFLPFIKARGTRSLEYESRKTCPD